jgi:hypothetical protein
MTSSGQHPRRADINVAGRFVLLAACLLGSALAASSQTVTLRGIAHNYGFIDCACTGMTLELDGGLGEAIVDSIPLPLLERHVQVTGVSSWCEDSFCPPGRFILDVVRVETLQTHTVERTLGWNLVSLPLLLNDSDRAAAFLHAASGPTAYRRGYVGEDTVLTGWGYWIRCADSAAAEFSGVPVEVETVAVEQGWNMVGSIHAPLLVEQVMRLDTTMVLSPFYGYDPVSGQYVLATHIVPWAGYWVKANHAGLIVLRDPAHGNAPGAAWRVRIVEKPGDLPAPPKRTPQHRLLNP